MLHPMEVTNRNIYLSMICLFILSVEIESYKTVLVPKVFHYITG